MNIQRFILCCAVALAAFGASLGLIELGNYVRTVFTPEASAEIKLLRAIPAPTIIVPPDAKFNPPINVPATEIVPEGDTDEPYVNEYGNNGEYFIAGKDPAGFEDFNSLSFIERDWSEKRNRVVAVKPSGTIHAEREFEFSRINVTGSRIAAVTRTIKGISYQFDGKFVNEKIKVKNADGYEYEADILLKGRLTKWRNGKKIAEAKVKLEMGGC